MYRFIEVALPVFNCIYLDTAAYNICCTFYALLANNGFTALDTHTHETMLLNLILLNPEYLCTLWSNTSTPVKL